VKLSDSSIAISGGQGSVGSILCRNLEKKAKKVVSVDRHSSSGDYSVQADLSDPDQAAEVAQTLFRQHNVRILINCVGTIHNEMTVKPFQENDPVHRRESWRDTLRNNIDSVFFLSSCFARQLFCHREGGLIVNFSSVAAAGNVGQSAYGASKAALESLTRTWAMEFGPMKVRVAAIAPGFLDVESTRLALSTEKQQELQSRTPLRRFGTAEELCHAVIFIIENDYFHGRILHLDGGISLS
jgi:3-oxoacyl-[acyl-carrier protein] reductase